MGFVGDLWDDLTGQSAAEEGRKAGQEALGYQQQALDYLQQQAELPTAYRDAALSGLGSFYGIQPQTQPALPPPTDGGLGRPMQTEFRRPVQGAMGILNERVQPYVDRAFQGEPDPERANRILQTDMSRPRTVTGISPAPGVPGAIRDTRLEDMPVTIDQAGVIQQAIDSPLYQALMGTRESAEEAILRNAAATGGLRSGNVQQALADTAADIERDALLQSYARSYGEQEADLMRQLQQEQQLYGREQTDINRYLGGLQSLAGLQTYTPQIAQQMTGMGQTAAQSRIGAAQAQQAGLGGLLNLGGSLGAAYLMSPTLSDIRLKSNVERTGSKNGHNWYKWTWNNIAKGYGLEGESEGLMAHEVYEVNPDAVTVNDDGHIMVNYEVALNG